MHTTPAKQHVDAALSPRAKEAEIIDNSLLARIPALPDIAKLPDALSNIPPYCTDDRSLPLAEKLRRLRGVRELFVATGRVVELALDFHATLCAGYAMRNPNGPDVAAIRRELYNADRQKGFSARIPASTRHADALTILGDSGSGKSAAMNAVLKLYPQLIHHDDDDPQWVQIVWLVVEMHVDGSLKQLLACFFAAVDDLLGTHYGDLYGKRAVTLDERMLAAEQVVARHHIGAIIFEEVQMLRAAGEDGAQKFANFVTRLLNRVRCPVVFIGTRAAAPLLSRELHEARRCGSTYLWTQYTDNADWKRIITALTTYIYGPVEWPDDVEPAAFLCDRAQGLLGIAVPLYIAAQMKALINAQPFSPAFVDWTLEHRFSLVKPILDAMHLPEPERSKVLAKCGDMRVSLLDEEVNAATASIAGRRAQEAHAVEFHQVREERRTRLLEHLRSMDYASSAAVEVVDRIIDDARYMTDVDLIVAAVQKLKSTQKRKPKLLEHPAPLAADDLRRLGAAAT